MIDLEKSMKEKGTIKMEQKKKSLLLNVNTIYQDEKQTVQARLPLGTIHFVIPGKKNLKV